MLYFSFLMGKGGRSITTQVQIYLISTGRKSPCLLFSYEFGQSIKGCINIYTSLHLKRGKTVKNILFIINPIINRI